MHQGRSVPFLAWGGFMKRDAMPAIAGSQLGAGSAQPRSRGTELH